MLSAFQTNTKVTSLVLVNALVTDALGHVAKENFTLFKYVLNLPGSTSGSYSRNLNHLWFLRSVVLFWKAPFVEWYFPALRAGETHLEVDADSLVDTVRDLERGAVDATALLDNAARVDADLLCPSCLADYVATLLGALRGRFSMGKILDDPCLAHQFFTHLNCSHLDLVEVKHTVRPPSHFDIDARRALLTTVDAEPLPGAGCAALADIAESKCRLNATSLGHHHKSHHTSFRKAFARGFVGPSVLPG